MSSGSKGRIGWGRTLVRLLPLAVPFVLLFGGGLTLAVGQSLGYWLPFPHHGHPLDAYAELLEPNLLASFGMSLWVGLASATISVALGAVLAYGLWRLPQGLQRAAVVYKTPLILPHVAVGFIILVLFSQSGWFASLAHYLGIIDAPAQFPPLLYRYGLGMILAYVYKSTPFAILLAWAALRRMDPRLVQTALMFGAGRVEVFRRIVLPHIRGVLNTTFIILFLYAFGAFDIPFLLGESNPGMLSVRAYNLYFRRDLANRPTAMAILVLMFLFSAAFIVIYVRVASRISGRERKL